MTIPNPMRSRKTVRKTNQMTREARGSGARVMGGRGTAPTTGNIGHAAGPARPPLTEAMPWHFREDPAESPHGTGGRGGAGAGRGDASARPAGGRRSRKGTRRVEAPVFALVVIVCRGDMHDARKRRIHSK